MSLPWVAKGSLAVADQAIFAGSNFILNILLARWLSASEYGAFALVFSILLFMNVFYNALLTEPMLVFGSGKYRGRFCEYLGVLLRGHFALAVGCALLLAATTVSMRSRLSQDAKHACLYLAISAPFILLLWLLRRVFYIQLTPGWSAISGGIYLALLVGTAFALHSYGHLSAATGILAMGVASVGACLLLMTLLRPVASKDLSFIRAVAADHWRYGKWIAAAAWPGWVIESIYYMVLPISFGLAEAGALKALMNLAMPATNTIVALGILLVPALVRDRAFGGNLAIRRKIMRCIGLFFLFSGCYFVLLVGFRSTIFHMLYGSKYFEYVSWPLLLVALIPFAQSITAVAGGALKAIEQPRSLFWSFLVGGGVALTFGITCAMFLGTTGALLGYVISTVSTGSLAFFFIRQATGSEGASQ
jgi:O-antigen/teichoic acid export membrane protein